MNNLILTKKKRLQTALELMPRGLEHYYDLFCDHGLLGMAARDREDQASIWWNDINDALMDKVKERFELPENSLLRGEAQDLEIRSSSGVFLLGVGGHLISECLRHWQRVEFLNRPEQYFVLGPTYYLIPLRQCLADLGAHLVKRAFVWERGVGHELYLVSFPSERSPENWFSFDENFWLGILKEVPQGHEYLQKRYVSLQKNRHLSAEQKAYATALGQFLAKI